jgi:homoserine O-acetyltransferase/O-succinyltransferase
MCKLSGNSVRFHKWLSALFLLLVTGPAFSNPHQVPMERFALESGDTLAPAVVSYSMFGRFNADSSNVVLVCTWFTGKSPDVGRLWTAETGYLDTSRFAVIVIDAFGNGLSNSPSNYSSASFPEITMADMVRMQHEALTRHLGIHKLYAVAGISMGGMQAWQWVALYPFFMQKMVAISATPSQSAYDQLFWSTTLSLLQLSLKKDPEVRDSLLRTVAMLQELHLYTPAYRNTQTKADSATEWIRNTVGFSKDADPRNWICQVKAMLKHDVFRYRSKEKWTKNTTCKMLLIVPQNDLMVNPSTSLAIADLVGTKLIVLKDDCGHQSSVLCGKEEIKRVIQEFL